MEEKKRKLSPPIVAIGILSVLVVAMALFILTLFLSGFQMKWPLISLDEIIPGMGGTEYQQPVELPDEFQLLVEAWDMVTDTYVDPEKLDNEKLSQGSVKGLLDALDDPFSYYVDPEMYELEMSSFSGKYQGIGAYVGLKDDLPTIITPLEGSPAEEAGLKAGDKILEVDGKSTIDRNLNEVVLWIQGPEGTPVTLQIISEDDEEPREVVLVRREITLQSVRSEVKDNIALIRISTLMKTTGGDLKSALKDVINDGVDGIVLDLRNNPGGLLTTAVDVSAQFLNGGVVVNVIDNEGHNSPLAAGRGGLATQIPMVVLVNEGSASGAEVIAGALQDYGRAKLAGTKTYGKGSVQTVRTLEDGSALHITTAHWFTPLGNPINGEGLTPDFELELEDEELVDWAINYLKSEIAMTGTPVESVNKT
jgi:carboxyl-terminal processing protease